MADVVEVAELHGDLLRLIDHVVACLDGLSEDEADRRPPAKGANSLLVIATYTLGAPKRTSSSSSRR